MQEPRYQNDWLEHMYQQRKNDWLVADNKHLSRRAFEAEYKEEIYYEHLQRNAQ